MGNAVALAADVRQTAQPPQMMLADVAIAPVAAGDKPLLAGKVGEVKPIVATAGDRCGVAPVIIAHAVGSKVDIAAGCLAGMGFVIAAKLLPQIGGSVLLAVHVAHDGFDAVAEILQHFAHAALIAKAHDDKTLLQTAVLQRRRITPNGICPHHNGFVVTGIGKTKQPNFVNFAAVDPARQVKLAQQMGVIKQIGLMKTTVPLPAGQIGGGIVAEAIGLARKFVQFNLLNDLVVGVAIAGIGDIGHVLRCQLVGVVPAEMGVKGTAVYPRRMNNHQHPWGNGRWQLSWPGWFFCCPQSLPKRHSQHYSPQPSLQPPKNPLPYGR